MTSFNPRLIESLESRTLLSVSPATLTQDQQVLNADTALYATDKQHCANLIAKDKAQVAQDRVTANAGVVALQRQLKTDQLARKSTLQLDRADQKLAVRGDTAVIARDKVAVRVDKNNPTQLAADKAKLVQDKLQLETDKVKFGTIILNDDAATQSVVLQDQQAIENARFHVDNTALAQDEKTLLADQKSCLTMLAGDQIKILNDRLKVAQDTINA